MSVASRSIMEGLAIGKALGEPFARAGLMQMRQKFEDEQRQKAFQDQLAKLTLENPNLAAGSQDIEAGRTVDGQTSVLPLKMTPEQQVAIDSLRLDKSTWGKPNPVTDGRAEKGAGFLGLKKNSRGGVSSEISVGVEFDGKERDIPTMVPTLSADEVDYLLKGGDPRKNQSIMGKAVAHAQERLAQGKSPFASDSESPPVDIPEVPTLEIAGRAYNPAAIKEANLADRAAALKQQFEFQKEIAGLPTRKSGFNMSPGEQRWDYDENGKPVLVATAPAKGTEPKAWTLSPGQKVIDETGKLIAENAGNDPKPTVLSPGQKVFDKDGKVLFENPAIAKTDIKMSEADKHFVDTLASGIGKKTLIADQLEQGFNALINPTVNKTTKLYTAKQMLKTLNSTEGADAIGLEEAKRLGGLLEFNFFSPYDAISGQGALFGRDMAGFTEQVNQTLKNIRGAIGAGQQRISEVESKYAPTKQVPVSQPTATTSTNSSDDVAGAAQWLKDNPKDPKAPAVRQRLMELLAAPASP